MRQKQTALRALSESRGNKVAACWYDQSYAQLVDHQKEDTKIRDERQKEDRDRA